MRNTPSRATSKKGNPKNRVIPSTRPKPGPVPGHGLPIQKPRRPIPIRKPGPVPGHGLPIQKPRRPIPIRKPGPVPGHGLPIQKPRRPIPDPRPTPQYSTWLKQRPLPVRKKTKFRKGRVTIRKEGKQWIIIINGIPKFKSSTKKLANQKATLLRFQMK